MAAPVMTFGAQAGLLASQSLASGASVTFAWDLSAKFEGQLQCKNTFPNSAPATTTGLLVSVYRRFGAGPTDDNQPVLQFTVPSTQNVANYQSVALPTGKYDVTFKNTDTGVAVTVEATGSTVDSLT